MSAPDCFEDACRARSWSPYNLTQVQGANIGSFSSFHQLPDVEHLADIPLNKDIPFLERLLLLLSIDIF